MSFLSQKGWSDRTLQNFVFQTYPCNAICRAATVMIAMISVCDCNWHCAMHSPQTRGLQMAQGHMADCRSCGLQVFDAKDWDALVMRSIVPKLAWALQDVLVINPLQQDLAPFHWLTAWHAVLPQHHMVNLLQFRFFPAWHRVLQHWLSSSPDFDEVTRWYLGWKVSHALPCYSWALKLRPSGRRLPLIMELHK